MGYAIVTKYKLRIKYNGTSLGFFGTINFTGAGVVVTNAGGGQATVTISGGAASPWETGAGTPSAQLIGSGSNSTGDYSVAGGEDADASGEAAAAFGLHTRAVGDNSFAVGAATHAEAESSVAMGRFSQTQFLGEFAQASSDFSTPGDSQVSTVVVSNIADHVDSKRLYLDGTAQTLSLDIPTDESWGVYVHCHAVNVGGGAGDFLEQDFFGSCSNVAGTLTSNFDQPTRKDLGTGAGWPGFAVAVDSSSFYVVFVGSNMQTIRMVCSVRIIRIKFSLSLAAVGVAIVGSTNVVG